MQNNLHTAATKISIENHTRWTWCWTSHTHPTPSHSNYNTRGKHYLGDSHNLSAVRIGTNVPQIHLVDAPPVHMLGNPKNIYLRYSDSHKPLGNNQTLHHARPFLTSFLSYELCHPSVIPVGSSNLHAKTITTYHPWFSQSVNRGYLRQTGRNMPALTIYQLASGLRVLQAKLPLTREPTRL